MTIDENTAETAPETAPERTFYDILGVDPDAGQDEVHRAFMRRLQVHNENPTAEGEAELVRVRQAYKILSNPESRFLYNKQRALARPPERRWDRRERGVGLGAPPSSWNPAAKLRSLFGRPKDGEAPAQARGDEETAG